VFRHPQSRTRAAVAYTPQGPEYEFAQPPADDEVRHVNSCFFTMIAVDDDRIPVQVPRLAPSNPDEERRYQQAKARKELRLALDQP
jgi:acyl-CoA hydrolase